MKIASLDDLLDLDEETVSRIHLAVEVEARRQRAQDDVARAIADRQEWRRRAAGS